MQNKQDAQFTYVQKLLPWIMGVVALVLYLATLNQWVSLSSLPLAAKITGWDPNPPFAAPLLFLVTYPLRWLSAASQPFFLNVMTAAMAALTAVILARSVSLLPHDRTHEQRQRERSEFSLLSIPTAWLPPVFAVLALILELTMWENSVVGTGEVLDVLIFAYVIRCLLEFRISQKDLWLYKLSLVYGLGVTNNYALIGFFPLFLIAILWVKGLSFFKPGFIGIMLGLGLIGLSLHLLLPAIWISTEYSNFKFWDLLKSSLANQKSLLLTPPLRSRVFILSLTSILPVIVMGIRWPSSFGDTSAAGATVTNLMFRIIHMMFLTAAVFITMDQKFSPRALSFGLVPFLTFYYLGALAIGYYSGYGLLVFGKEAKRGSRRGGTDLDPILNPLMLGVVWILALGLPVYLCYKNLPVIRADNGSLLKQFVTTTAESLPPSGAIVLSEDSAQLLLLESIYGKGGADRNILVSTRSIDSGAYHEQLLKKFPNRWPRVANLDAKRRLDASEVQNLLAGLSRTGAVYYVHPSFGYFFESVAPETHGAIYKLSPAVTNRVAEAPLTPAQIQENSAFWSKAEPILARLEKVKSGEATDARYLATYYSRALNYWGVELQKNGKLAEAAPLFQRAALLNTNNLPASVNGELNVLLRSGKPVSSTFAKITEDKFGKYRSWDGIMADNGPFDEPSYAFNVGEIFMQQGLYRQSALIFDRIKTLAPDNFPSRLLLGRAYLFGRWPDQAMQAITEARTYFQKQNTLSLTNDLELVALEAGVHFAKTNFPAAEKLLLGALVKHPGEKVVMESLVELYRSTDRPKEAIAILDQTLAANPSDLSPRLIKADVLLKSNAIAEARDEVDKVLKAAPNNPTALLYRVFVLLKAKDYAQGLSDVKKILANDPENVQALIYEGILNLESKNYAQGIPPLNKALKLQPSSWVALQNRAILNLQAGNLDDARKDYQSLAKLFPEMYALYYGMGEIAYRQKNKAEAIENYEMYLRYAPTNGNQEQLSERNQVNDRLKEIKAGR